MYAVVATPTAVPILRRAVERLMPPTGVRIERGGFTFLLYSVGASTIAPRDLNFVDPTDGQQLVELRYFLTETEARAWVDQRVAVATADGRAM